VAAFLLLLVGVICAGVSRVLLFVGATSISVKWSLGVWLPFGPFFFRRNYPDQAKLSAPFRIVTMVCLGLFLFVGSRGNNSTFNFIKQKSYGSFKTGIANGYGMEEPNTAEERKAANVKELDRLTKWGEELKLKKRDLLKSDVEGNHAYDKEFAKYNAALSKANAERVALAAKE
jgi:hypothetical protein